jgi:hypothetical protein
MSKSTPSLKGDTPTLPAVKKRLDASPPAPSSPGSGFVMQGTLGGKPTLTFALGSREWNHPDVVAATKFLDKHVDAYTIDNNSDGGKYIHVYCSRPVKRLLLRKLTLK